MAVAESGAKLKPKINSKGKMECPICGRAFHSSDFYERHLEVDHPDKFYS